MGFGLRLEEIMKEKGINANELALKIGVTPSTLYSMIKRDSSRVDIDLIIKIAHALGITADELLTGEKQASQPTTIAAHFDGDEYTPEQLAKIEEYARFVKTTDK